MNICTRVDGWWGLFLAFAGAAFPLAEYNAKLSGQFSRKMLFRAAYLNIYEYTHEQRKMNPMVTWLASVATTIQSNLMTCTSLCELERD